MTEEIKQPVTVPASEVKQDMIVIPLSEIHADVNFNCRGEISPIDVADLAKDIQIRGLIQPVVVTKYPDDRALSTGKKYLLVVGYRRFMACRMNEAKEINAIVKTFTDEIDARLYNLSENSQRKQLSILQEAKAILKLYELGMGEVEIAQKLNVSRGWVQVRVMLLKLPVPIQEEVNNGKISQANIRELYTLHQYGNEDQLFAAVRKLKDAKAKGYQISVKPDEDRKSKKVQRKRGEMFIMQEHIQGFLGNNLTTRTLAWACGEIDTDELCEDIQIEVEGLGKTYTPLK